jgi:hypothetical protein
MKRHPIAFMLRALLVLIAISAVVFSCGKVVSTGIIFTANFHLEGTNDLLRGPITVLYSGPITGEATGQDGVCIIRNLIPGTYYCIASKEGWRRVGVTLEITQSETFNASLDPSSWEVMATNATFPGFTIESINSCEGNYVYCGQKDGHGYIVKTDASMPLTNVVVVTPPSGTKNILFVHYSEGELVYYIGTSSAEIYTTPTLTQNPTWTQAKSAITSEALLGFLPGDTLEALTVSHKVYIIETDSFTYINNTPANATINQITTVGDNATLLALSNVGVFYGIAAPYTGVWVVSPGVIGDADSLSSFAKSPEETAFVGTTTGNIYFSPNIKYLPLPAWQSNLTGLPYAIKCIAHDNDRSKFYAVGENGLIMRSR